MNTSQIREILASAIQEVNAGRSDQSLLQPDATMPLVGPGAVLDSLELLHFLMTVEQGVAESCSHSISLLNEQTVSDSDGPLRHLDALTDYLKQQIDDLCRRDAA